MDEYEREGCVLLDPTYYDRLGDAYGVLVRYRDVYKEAAVRIAESDALSRLLALLVYALRDREFAKEDLKTFRQADSYLQGHPDMKHTPGVDMTSGSLGLGISAACGMALAGKLNKKDYRVYAILGDGECEEGQVWEAAMFAAHKNLDNLCAFVDFNGLQIDGPVVDVVNPTPIDKKFEAFNWNVIVIDGHNFEEIDAAVKAAKACKDKPTAIVCKCVKGKGVSFMENNVKWHGSAPNQEQYEQAVSEINAFIESL